jgi:hypothetical protein
MMAQSNESGSPDGPVGTWTVQVTLRDCSTGAALGPAFNSLVTFHRGGTLSESAGSTAFAPGQRTSGHGTWTRAERHTYQQQMVALIVFDTNPNLRGSPGFNPALPVSPGLFAGWATVTHTFEVVDADHSRSRRVRAVPRPINTPRRLLRRAERATTAAVPLQSFPPLWSSCLLLIPQSRCA